MGSRRQFIRNQLVETLPRDWRPIPDQHRPASSTYRTPDRAKIKQARRVSRRNRRKRA